MTLLEKTQSSLKKLQASLYWLDAFLKELPDHPPAPALCEMINFVAQMYGFVGCMIAFNIEMPESMD